ncbi:hypothetical protein [Spiroplasma endosymbiont of Dromius quadrimaculatus]|uniref:hypothetical protein n=1 Tax=Spiroplasma endosymbiont of Dromius quadrimaculatus TaxID=3066283 RepID=UPI00313D9DF3
MDKIISWFIIMFISLVPLGAFFDTKQPPKPNMEQSSLWKEKNAPLTLVNVAKVASWSFLVCIIVF